MPRILTFDELRDHGVLLGRRQLARLEAEGRFPKRVVISDARIGWLETEIDEHVRQKLSGRAKGVSLASPAEKAHK